MQIIVNGRHMTVTDPSASTPKRSSAGSPRSSIRPMVAEVELDAEKNPSTENASVAEVTVDTKGPVVRAEEAATDMYAAIDLAAEKVETPDAQVQEQGHRSPHRQGADGRQDGAGRRCGARRGRADEPIVKHQGLEAKPMTEEEAILQLELLGHDFFVFAPPRPRR